MTRVAFSWQQSYARANEPVTMVIDLPAWMKDAECRLPDAPPMFEDAWGEAGLKRRVKRTTALNCCRRCPVRLECGRKALEDVEAGMPLYGVVCGIEFTDVTPSRQEPLVEALRSVVVKLSQQVA